MASTVVTRLWDSEGVQSKPQLHTCFESQEGMREPRDPTPARFRAGCPGRSADGDRRAQSRCPGRDRDAAAERYLIGPVVEAETAKLAAL